MSAFQSKRDLASRNVPLITQLGSSPSPCPLGWVWPLPCFPGQLRGERAAAPAPKCFQKCSSVSIFWSAPGHRLPSCCLRKCAFIGVRNVLPRSFPLVPAAFPALWGATRTRWGWHSAQEVCEESCLCLPPSLLADLKVTKNTMSSIPM